MGVRWRLPLGKGESALGKLEGTFWVTGRWANRIDGWSAGTFPWWQGQQHGAAHGLKYTSVHWDVFVKFAVKFEKQRRSGGVGIIVSFLSNSAFDCEDVKDVSGVGELRPCPGRTCGAAAERNSELSLNCSLSVQLRWEQRCDHYKLLML